MPYDILIHLIFNSSFFTLYRYPSSVLVGVRVRTEGRQQSQNLNIRFGLELGTLDPELFTYSTRCYVGVSVPIYHLSYFQLILMSTY